MHLQRILGLLEPVPADEDAEAGEADTQRST
jgi:hypothetical protein